MTVVALGGHGLWDVGRVGLSFGGCVVVVAVVLWVKVVTVVVV